MNKFLKQLTSSSYWTLNKDLCKKIGLQNTLVLQHFIDLQFKIFDGKEFYQQQDRIQEQLGISERQVKQSIKQLIELKLITCEKRGVPAKNYYLTCQDNIILLVSSDCPNQLGQNDLTREDETTQQRKELNKKEIKKEIIKKELNYKIIENSNVLKDLIADL